MPYMSLLWCRPQRSSRLQNPLKRGARVQDSRRRDLKVGQHPGAPAGLISAPLYTDLSVKGQTLAAFENMSSPPTLGLIVDSIPAIKKYVLEWRILHWNSYLGQWQELRWSKTGHGLCWFGIWQGRVETSRLDLRSLVPSLALSVDTYHRIIPKSIYLSSQRLDSKNLGSLSWDVSRTSYFVWGKGFKIFLVSKLRPPIPSVFHHLPTWLYSR